MTIKEIQDSIVEEFSSFDDWMDRYSLLIEMGRECPIIDPQYRNDNYLINGCQSRVWLHAELKDGKIYFTADSDAVITKGIINLLPPGHHTRRHSQAPGNQDAANPEI